MCFQRELVACPGDQQRNGVGVAAKVAFTLLLAEPLRDGDLHLMQREMDRSNS
jgi:hypothetical protein